VVAVFSDIGSYNSAAVLQDNGIRRRRPNDEHE